MFLDGELSRTPNAQTGGAYFVTVRVTQEKPSRQLVAAWAGVAQNYRYLTGNLENRPDVNREGLLGEIGKQIAAFAALPASPANTQFAELVQKALIAGRVIATLVPEDGTKTFSVAAPTLQSGQNFRLQIAAEFSGSVIILREDGPQLIPLFMPAAAPNPWSRENPCWFRFRRRRLGKPPKRASP